MKKGFSIFLIGLLGIACGDGNIVILKDPTIQKAIDINLIENYLEDKGYSNFDTTSSGVRYVILNEGSGGIIDESDHVEFHYVGITLGDTIFDTSVMKVGDSLIAHYEDNPIIDGNDTIKVFTSLNYDPTLITYSASGWSIPDGFIQGYIDGIAATFKHLKVGGSSLILIPSNLAYGSRKVGYFIAPNTPIMFKLYPIKVEKQ